MSEHTPGPWRFNKHTDCILARSDMHVASVMRTGRFEANAALIAAAPKLLAALKAQASPYLEPWEKDELRNAAIAAAEGQS